MPSSRRQFRRGSRPMSGHPGLGRRTLVSGYRPARRREAAGCLKIYKHTATGTKVARPHWGHRLDDLRIGDTLVIWKIDRLGRNLRDLIDIVTTLESRGVGVQSLTNGIVDQAPRWAGWSGVQFDDLGQLCAPPVVRGSVLAVQLQPGDRSVRGVRGQVLLRVVWPRAPTRAGVG